MIEKDEQLLQALLDASSSGRLAWQETAKKGEFTTSVEGRFNATVAPPGGRGAVFELRDLQDRLLLQISASDNSLVDGLYELARRSAFHVEDAVEDALRLLRGP